MGKYGVFEDDVFVGAVLISAGAASGIHKPFGLQNYEVRELVRVALDEHETPTSRIVAIALRQFKKEHPEVRCLVSFADTAQDHYGTLYQAMGWLYLGSKAYHVIEVLGKREHPKTLHTRYGYGGQSIPWLQKNIDPNARRIITPPKHKYLWCYDDELKDEWKAKSLPYPKREKC